MKKILFTLLTITISIQGYSQTSQLYFHDLRSHFTGLHIESDQIRDRFMNLAQYSSWNSGEHQNMGQGNLANNWNNIRDRFNDLENHFDSSRNHFSMIEFTLHEIGNLLGNFDGTYGSLSGLPTLFDGNFSSLSGTPTTLAGYGITDGFSGNYSDLSGKPTFRDLSSSSPVVFGSLDAFGGTFSNKATIDVIADSNGDLITGYVNGVSGDRFNVKIDNPDESTIISSGGGYELKLYSESGYMTFEGMDMDGPVLFSFNGNTEVDGNTVIDGTAFADFFIGDGSQLTNLPFSYNSNEAGGIEVINYTTASGSNAFAVGNDNSASGSSSTATGRGTIASGDDSTAMGANTEASGDYSTALGRGTSSNGETATAIGQFTSASGKFSLSAGLYSNATGTTSVALGNNTIADGYGTLATGYFNTANANPQADSFDQFNTAFVIGNGTFENRSNAFEVLFDGTTTIAGDLNINSDARLKANIISLGSTLSKLLQLDGKSYTMKKDESEKQKIGILAQDIEKVFPELVSESHGVKSVNYQGLVPVLINALKEQDAMIKEQKNKLLEIESLVQDLINNQ